VVAVRPSEHKNKINGLQFNGFKNETRNLNLKKLHSEKIIFSKF
jgi:hypothetical protein